MAAHPDQFKAMAYLGEFLYYQNKPEEAETVLAHAYELGRNSGDVAPVILPAFLYASQRRREKLTLLYFAPSQTRSLMATKRIDRRCIRFAGRAPAGDCPAAPQSRSETITIPGSGVTKIGTACATIPTTRASWRSAPQLGRLSASPYLMWRSVPLGREFL